MGRATAREAPDPALFSRGIEDPAQQLRIWSPGVGHATLPAADQAPGNPELLLAKLDAQRHELTDQILLRPTPELALGPQFPILHNTPPQDERTCGAILISST